MAMAIDVSSVHSPGAQLNDPPPFITTVTSSSRGGPNSYPAPRASPDAMPRSVPAARSDWAVVKCMAEPTGEVRDIVVALLEGLRQLVAAAPRCTPTLMQVQC